LAQRRRSGTRQPDHEDRALDDFVVYLGMLFVGIDDPQTLNEGVTDGRVLNHPAQLVEIGFVVQRVDGALESLPIVGRPEIVEAGGDPCPVLQFVHGETHTANLS
jgi:hypothetical protein